MRRVDLRRLAALAAALGLALAPAPARAACTVSTAGVAFGAYNPQERRARRQHRHDPGRLPSERPRVAVLTRRRPVRLLFDAPDEQRRRQLNYNLYTNAGRTVVWGDGRSGSQSVR